MGRLDRRIAIVTGASRGLGRSIAELFAAEGAAVAVVARTEAQWDPRLPGTVHDTVAAIEAAGGRAVAVPADLAKPDEVEGIVDRMNGLNRRIRRSLNAVIAEHDLTYEEWDVLGALRQSGPPFRRSAGLLAKRTDLSSGAMTNRLDRLETAGLIRRLPDPNDRRGTLIEPTEADHAAWERCTGAQAQREALIASALSDREKEELHDLLRRLMRAFPPEYESTKKHRAEQDD